MSAPKHSGDAHPAQLSDSDIDFAGYDPYIVAITGGTSTSLGNDSGASERAAESRKVQLMAWLRKNGN